MKNEQNENKNENESKNENENDFTLSDLIEFINLESRRLQKNIYYQDKEKLILARTIKITEEVGELGDNVLAFLGLQRKEKLESYCLENLQHEFADVIFVTMLLAKTMDIDIVKALKDKIKKVNEYYDKNS